MHTLSETLLNLNVLSYPKRDLRTPVLCLCYKPCTLLSLNRSHSNDLAKHNPKQLEVPDESTPRNLLLQWQGKSLNYYGSSKEFVVSTLSTPGAHLQEKSRPTLESSPGTCAYECTNRWRSHWIRQIHTVQDGNAHLANTEWSRM
jgi:hypothetical protein